MKSNPRKQQPRDARSSTSSSAEEHFIPRNKKFTFKDANTKREGNFYSSNFKNIALASQVPPVRQNSAKISEVHFKGNIFIKLSIFIH